jgi:hypothetical protein
MNFILQVPAQLGIKSGAMQNMVDLPDARKMPIAGSQNQPDDDYTNGGWELKKNSGFASGCGRFSLRARRVGVAE